MKRGTVGGHFFDNHITSNVPAAWVASRYGAASKTKIYNNTIVKSVSANENFKPFRMGWDGYYKCVATDVQFRSNVIEGAGFGIDATGQDHSYEVYWTLEIQVSDKKGHPLAGKEVRILDKNGEEVFKQETGPEGTIIRELSEYSFISAEKVLNTPYTVIVGKKKQKVELTSNSVIAIISR